MEINSLNLFHIHRENCHSQSWKVGNRIKGESIKTNHFFHKYKTNYTHYDDGSGPVTIRKAIQKFDESSEEYKSGNIHELLKSCKRAINNETTLIRELSFENIRLNKYPNLPSRLNCIYVCREIAVEQWWNRLAKDGTNCKIFKLKLSGEIHTGDRKFLMNDTVSLCEIEFQALSYWSGEKSIDPENEEILFQGEIEILAEYFNIEEFKRDRGKIYRYY